jgi:hypothetical protein
MFIKVLKYIGFTLKLIIVLVIKGQMFLWLFLNVIWDKDMKELNLILMICNQNA